MNRKLISLCLAAVMAASAAPSVSAAESFPVRINEICSHGSKTCKDSNGKTPDYIELYNSSDKKVSLEGMGLSDKKEEPFLFKFPKGASIPAKGYIIVFCDDGAKGTKGEYHAPFKLSGEGETVYLTSSSKKSADKVTFPSMGEEMVYGRVKDGDSFDIMTPTPKKSNASAKSASFAEKPVFSKESGFYKEEFELSLSCGKGCTVYYTTDGSDPRSSKTAVKYSGGIKIYNNTNDENIASAQKNVSLMKYSAPNHKVDKGMVIRAVSKNSKGVYSEVVTESYFINKSASYYKNMTVISLVTDSENLFDYKKGIYTVGESYDKWKKSSDYKKYDDVDSKNVTNYNQRGKEWERPADIQVFRNGREVIDNSVGIRITGNYSRSYPQKSFTFFARNEYGSSKMKYELFKGFRNSSGKSITSFDTFTVRNGGNECTSYMTSRMRDSVANELASGLSFSAAASENCILFLNGEFWGYYSLNEKLGESYISSHYGVDRKNISIIKNWEHSGSRKSFDDYVSFHKWAMGADMSSDANYKKFCENIDIQSFMDYIAFETYICNNDWSNLDYVNNYMLWRADKTDGKNPYADGKWRYMLYDSEFSSGLYWMKETSHEYDSLSRMNKEKTWGNTAALFYKVMENKDFRKAFYNNYKKMVNTTFKYSRVEKIINRKSSEIKAASEATDRRFGLQSDFDGGAEQVLSFYRNRPEYALKYLDKLMEKYE